MKNLAMIPLIFLAGCSFFNNDVRVDTVQMIVNENHCDTTTLAAEGYDRMDDLALKLATQNGKLIICDNVLFSTNKSLKAFIKAF